VKSKSSANPPHGYDVTIYLGKYNVKVAIDISGRDLRKAESIGLEMSSKVMEVCEERDVMCYVTGK